MMHETTLSNTGRPSRKRTLDAQQEPVVEEVSKKTAAKQSSGKSKQDKKGAKASAASTAVRENEERMKIPYGLVISPPMPLCLPSSHLMKSNCSGNPWCVYGLGENKDGVWKDPPLAVQKLLDVSLLQRKNEDGKLFPVGLKNLGGTCYLNVLVQALYHNLLIRDAIFNTHVSSSSSSSSGSADLTQIQKVVLELQNVFANMKHSKRSSYDINTFVELLNLNKTDQQDPLEFFSLFREKCLIDENGEQPKYDTNRLSISQLLSGKEQYITTCKGCQNDYNGYESVFRELTVSIDKCSSLEQALKNLFEESILDGENQYNCEKCQGKKNAGRRCEIAVKPEVLFLALSRYVYDIKSNDKKKLRHVVEFGNSLKLKDEEYHLVSVLYHKGASAHGGHYVADVLDWENDLWWHCDDEIVKLTVNPSKSTPSSSSQVSSVEESASSLTTTEVVDLVDVSGDDDGDDSHKGKAKGKRGAAGAAANAKSSKALKISESDVAPDKASNKSATGKKTKKSSKENASGSRNNAPDAYMLVYVKLSRLEEARRDHNHPEAQMEIVSSVETLNDAFQADLAEYEKLKSIAEKDARERRAAYESLASQLVPKTPDDPFRLVPTVELRKWITMLDASDLSISNELNSSSSMTVDLTESGVAAVIDLSDSGSCSSLTGPALSAPQSIGYCQQHGEAVGISLDSLSNYKIISKEAYDYIFPGHNSGQHFDQNNYQCKECCAALVGQQTAREQAAEKYQSILSLIDETQTATDAGDPYTYLLSKKWLRELNSVAASVSDGGAKVKAKAKTGVASEASLQSVNVDLICAPHKEKSKTAISSKVMGISNDAWYRIADIFPDAHAVLASAPSCPLCQESATEGKSVAKELANSKKTELKNLAGLEELMSRKEKYPSYFTAGHSNKRNKEDLGVHYLVDAGWLKQLREYYSTPSKIQPPAVLENSRLRCTHGAWVGSDDSENIVKDGLAQKKITELGDGLPEAEIVNEPQWKSLMKLMDTWRTTEESSKMQVDEEDGVQQVAYPPFEVKLTNKKWMPQCCDDCKAEKKRNHLATISEYKGGTLYVTILGPEETPPDEAQGVEGDSETGAARRSSRPRTRRMAEKFTVTASSDDSLFGLKWSIYQELVNSSSSVSAEPGKQTIFWKGKVLEPAGGQQTSLRDLSIIDGANIFVRISEDYSNMDDEFTGERKAELGFSGTFLSFNGSSSSSSASSSSSVVVIEDSQDCKTSSGAEIDVALEADRAVDAHPSAAGTSSPAPAECDDNLR